MRALSSDGVWTWSVFQEDRGIDFNGFFWTGCPGSILIDPMTMNDDDISWVKERGGVDWILLTNADHLRDSVLLKSTFKSRLFAPSVEKARLGDSASSVDLWYQVTKDLPEKLRPFIEVRPIRGGKSEVEYALWIRPLECLLFGDIVRTDPSGRLVILPDAKLTNKTQVIEDLTALSELNPKRLLLGDGVCEIDEGDARLYSLLASLKDELGSS